MTISAETDDIVSFQLVTSGIITSSFTDAKVLGTMNFEGARYVDPELSNKHYNLYPYFKDSVNNVDNPAAYKYLILLLKSGSTEAIGIPWISADSFKTVGNKTATIVITGYQEKYADPIKDLLGNLGAAFTYTVS